MPGNKEKRAFVKAEDKVLYLEQLLARLESQRAAGKKIVFTNGCFDILHPGHVAYLEDARACGDLLVVGLNSDSSVRRIKGPQRPINRQEDRAIMLAGLASVDYVTFFEDDTPLELIKAVRPHVLVKGGDWTIENIVGADFVMSYGGEVYSLAFREGYSTTALIKRIKALKDITADDRRP